MSKVVLVMDRPMNCATCPCVSNELRYCRITSRCLEASLKISIPAWCPLKKLPEEDKFESIWDEYDDGYVSGWNAYRRELLSDDN